MTNADATEIDDDKVFDVGAWKAVEVWMDLPGKELPDWWRDELIERGLGFRTSSGRIALTLRGSRIEDKLLAIRRGNR